MARRLFGTDGIRGKAGEAPLNPGTVHALGEALGHWAKHHAESPEVLIGMDTRESSPVLARQVAGGLAEAGVKPRFAGLITTPGVAYLTRTLPFVAGVMISASHNPYQDNGIKVFDHSGYKLPDEQELILEEEIFRITAEDHTILREEDPSVEGDLDEAYVHYLLSLARTRLDDLKLVIDCANGAASHLADDLFKRLGATVETVGCSPDGRNINLDCGALHLDSLRERVLATNADAGVAFDGDADRCMLVSHSGKVIDGDAVLLIVGAALHRSAKLAANDGRPLVVATVMSNLGLERALDALGIQMLRTPVGDKYVLEEMIRRGAVLGGEQSGHVIFRDAATTGDGMLTALRVLETVKMSGRDLDDLSADLKVFPQLLVNVRIAERRALADLPLVQDEIRLAEQSFGEWGRVLVRFSGTEPLARVMVEGPDEAGVHAAAHRIADAIRTEIGAAGLSH